MPAVGFPLAEIELIRTRLAQLRQVEPQSQSLPKWAIHIIFRLNSRDGKALFILLLTLMISVLLLVPHPLPPLLLLLLLLLPLHPRIILLPQPETSAGRLCAKYLYISLGLTRTHCSPSSYLPSLPLEQYIAHLISYTHLPFSIVTCTLILVHNGILAQRHGSPTSE